MGTTPYRKLAGRTIVLALFALPILQIAAVLSVGIHEILGHGLSAVLLGGTFSGFILKWDGMGWAFAALPPEAPMSHHILFRASGAIVTTLFGGILLGLALALWKKTTLRLTLLLLSFLCLMDGIPYALWNAYHPVLPGDFEKIIILLSSHSAFQASVVRWTLVSGSALLFVGTTFYFYTALFMTMEELILDGSRFTGLSRCLALLVLLVAPGSFEWLSFDWNQLIPGIGRLPQITGLLSIVVTAMILLWYKPKTKRKGSVHPITWRHIAVSWIGLVVTIISLLIWFQDGLYWS